MKKYQLGDILLDNYRTLWRVTQRIEFYNSSKVCLVLMTLDQRAQATCYEDGSGFKTFHNGVGDAILRKYEDDAGGSGGGSGQFLPPGKTLQ